MVFLCWHDEHPCLRRECCDEGVGGAELPVRELGLLRRAEAGGQATVWKVRACSLGAPTAEQVTRANRRAPADSSEPGNPVDPVVENVPQTGQDAAGHEDPGYLGSRDVHIEPVQGIAIYHGIDRNRSSVVLLSAGVAVARESPTLPGIGVGRHTRRLAERLSLVASPWADPGVSMADAARIPWIERAAETLGHDAGQG